MSGARNGIAQKICRTVARAAGGHDLGSNEYSAAQEGSRGNHNARARNQAAGFENHSAHPAGFDFEANGLVLNNGQAWSCTEHRLQSMRICTLITLRPGGLDGRAFAGIEGLRVDGGAIRIDPHFAAHGVNFRNDMGFGHAPDGGVAGHSSDGGERERDKDGWASEPRGGQCGFRARVAASDDQDGVWRGVHFPIQNREKILSKRSSS
jgi:hypothetical protein